MCCPVEDDNQEGHSISNVYYNIEHIFMILLCNIGSGAVFPVSMFLCSMPGKTGLYRESIPVASVYQDQAEQKRLEQKGRAHWSDEFPQIRDLDRSGPFWPNSFSTFSRSSGIAGAGAIKELQACLEQET